MNLWATVSVSMLLGVMIGFMLGTEATIRDKNKPSAIVTCRICKWNSGTSDKPFCQFYDMPHKAEFYCANGEAKENKLST